MFASVPIRLLNDVGVSTRLETSSAVVLGLGPLTLPAMIVFRSVIVPWNVRPG